MSGTRRAPQTMLLHEHFLLALSVAVFLSGRGVVTGKGAVRRAYATAAWPCATDTRWPQVGSSAATVARPIPSHVASGTACVPDEDATPSEGGRSFCNCEPPNRSLVRQSRPSRAGGHDDAWSLDAPRCVLQSQVLMRRLRQSPMLRGLLVGLRWRRAWVAHCPRMGSQEFAEKGAYYKAVNVVVCTRVNANVLPSRLAARTFIACT